MADNGAGSGAGAGATSHAMLGTSASTPTVGVAYVKRRGGGSRPARAARAAGISFSAWKQAKNRLASEAAPTPTHAAQVADEAAAWVEAWDHESGAHYWYNEITHESSWHKPSHVPVTSQFTCPKPTLFCVARMSVAFRASQQEQLQQEVQWVEGNLLEYEMQVQVQLREQIAALRDELNGEDRNDLKDLFAACADISKKTEKNEVEAAAVSEVDRQVNSLWDEFVEEGQAEQGAVELERLRQKEKMEARVKERKLKLLRKQVAEAQAKLAAKRAEAQAAIDAAKTKFQAVLGAHDLACGMLRKAIQVRRTHKQANAALDQAVADGFVSHTGDGTAPLAASIGPDQIVAASGGELYEGNAWVQLLDPATDMPYYYNQLTQAVQWEPPAGFDDTHFYDAADECLDEAASLGEQWVTADALEEQRRITAQLQAEAESLAAEKEAQGDPRYFLQLFEEMIEANENQTEEDQEKQTAHQMTVAHAEYKAEAEARQMRQEAERVRQKQSMEERLRRRREKARLHRMPSFRAAETKIHQQRARVHNALRLLKTERAWIGRRLQKQQRQTHGVPKHVAVMAVVKRASRAWCARPRSAPHSRRSSAAASASPATGQEPPVAVTAGPGSASGQARGKRPRPRSAARHRAR